MNKTLTGRWGEAEAAKFLRKKGYKVVAANYHTTYGEIDLIIENKQYIAFVEVKLRKSDDFAKPMEFVTKHKVKKLRTCALLWLARNPTGLQPRFDIVEVYAPEGITSTPVRIEHIENAFE